MLNMALLLRVVNEGEHVVVNQVVEEVDPSVEVGVDIGRTTPGPDFSVNEGKPRMHTTLLSVFRTGGPQSTSKSELRAPNPGW